MHSELTVEAYLERVACPAPEQATPESLRRLHRAHLLAVPFENLDIPLGRPITPSIPAFYDKIVRRRRGGFCYELNGLFGWLLGELGFGVRLLSARVFDGDQPGPEYDHLVLLVDMDARWIADVGFGDSFLEPLRLDTADANVQRDVAYRLVGSGHARTLQRRPPAKDWEPQYVFSLTPRRLSQFSAMCAYQQTSPDSVFTRKTVCSRATADGRVTLSNDRLITTTARGRTERTVANANEYRALLKAHFGVDLGDETSMAPLMRRG